MTVHQKDDCPCGSGKRYKHCHGPIDEAKKRRVWTFAIATVGAIVVGGAAWGAWQSTRSAGGTAVAARDSAGAAGPGGTVVLNERGEVVSGDVSGAVAPSPSTFGIVQPGMSGRAPIPTSTVGTTIPVAPKGALAPGEHPGRWEYDVAKNRHYDPRPDHMHWHNGPPPSDTTQAVVTAPRQLKLDEKGNIIGETQARVAGSAPSVTPSVGAWAGGHQALAPGEKPKDWEYDAKNDRYYDPGHGHWHSGKPPAGK